MRKTNPIPDSLKPAREGDHLLITTSSGRWAKGPTIKDAKKALRDVSGPGTPKAWRVRSIDPRTYIDGNGGIVYFEDGNVPLVIAEYDE